MENIIVTRSLKRQLDQFVLHGIANGVNLSANQVEQWFKTLRKVS
jgi:hypothetical protein